VHCCSVILYELLALETPFKGNRTSSIQQQQQQQQQAAPATPVAATASAAAATTAATHHHHHDKKADKKQDVVGLVKEVVSKDPPPLPAQYSADVKTLCMWMLQKVHYTVQIVGITLATVTTVALVHVCCVGAAVVSAHAQHVSSHVQQCCSAVRIISVQAAVLCNDCRLLIQRINTLIVVLMCCQCRALNGGLLCQKCCPRHS
jgi:hypothetical protein